MPLASNFKKSRLMEIAGVFLEQGPATPKAPMLFRRQSTRVRVLSLSR